MAAGRPYELSPEPNYGLCTDPGDAQQLTDGEALGASWGSPSTVGWAHVGQPTVTLDLGQVEPIERVCFYSVGGGHADVYFPAVTAILVNDEGQDYYLAGVISGSGALVQDGQRAYGQKFESGPLRSQARYVRLVFRPQERFLFLDEVEIWGGEARPEAPSAPTREPVTEEKLAGIFAAGLRAQWVAVEWLEVREQIQRMLTAGKRDPAPVTPRLEQMQDRALRLDVTDQAATDQLRKDYLQLRAEVARPLFASEASIPGEALIPGEASIPADLLCQTVDPWADLRGSLFPEPPVQPAPEVVLSLWQDEYEAVAWMITNLKEEPQRVTVQVAPLQDEKGQAMDWAGRLWLREALPVPSARGYRVQDALPLLSRELRNPDFGEEGPKSGSRNPQWSFHRGKAGSCG